MLDVSKGKATAEFCSLPARVFKTIEVDLTEKEDPQAALLKAIQKKDLSETVVRLIYKLRADQVEAVDNTLVGEALEKSHSYSIQPQLVSQLSRPRLPELGVDSSLAPMSALQSYLNNREDLSAIAPDILEAAQGLLNEDPYGDKAIVAPEEDPDGGLETVEDDVRQLRLL